MSHTETTAARVPCPFCAEDILPNAIKCKHCGEWLDVEHETTPTSLETVMGYDDRRDDASVSRAVAQGVRGDRHSEGHFVMKTLGLVALFVFLIWQMGAAGFYLGLLLFVVGFIKARTDYYQGR